MQGPGVFSAVRLIATDLDGTLVRSDDSITSNTVDVLTKFEQAGGYLTVCTGRPATKLDKVMADLPLNAPAVCANGAQVFDPLTGSYYKNEYLPTETICGIIRACYRDGIDFSFRGDDECEFVNRDDTDHPLFRNMGMRIPGVSVINVASPDMESTIAKYKVFKFICYVTGESQFGMFTELSRGGNAFSLFRSDGDVLEIAPAGCDKGSGLDLVLEILGLDRTQCCAFGDYGNDIMLLANAGIAVCTANGSDELKSCADYICAGNDDDGVAEFVKSHLL